MKKKQLCLLLICLLGLSLLLGGCGQKAAVEPTPTVSPTSPAFDMKTLEGVYAEEIAHRGVIRLTAMDAQRASLVIDWPGSAAQSAHWELHASCDASGQALTYNDAVLIEKAFSQDGSESDKLISTHGTGSFALSGGKLIWTDDSGYLGGEPATFVYVMTMDEYDRQQAAETPAPTATPAPAATPEPTTTPAPTPGAPRVTKSPTDESVLEGGACWFVANYENAIWAVWHFVSPDGKTDMTYDAAAEQFPTLKIIDGMYSSMRLENIPLNLNGWRVYCRYSNNIGYTDTGSALITVSVNPNPSPTPAPSPAPAPAPTPTPAPTPAPGPLGPVVYDWTDTKSLDDAVRISGVDFDPPMAVPEGLRLLTYSARPGIIEAVYTDDNSSNVLTVRKSATESGTALSGDYNNYSQTWDLSLKGAAVRCQGDGNTANAAYLSSGTGNFSLSYNPGEEGKGLTADQINSIINGMQ